MGFLGGGSKTTKTTSNENFNKTTTGTLASSSTQKNAASPWLQETYGGAATSGANATNIIASLLGAGGDPAAGASAFDRFKDLAGYAPALADMTRGVTGGAAAKGILNSGMTGRKLMKEGANLNSGMFGNFLQYLQGLSGLGLQGAGLIANAADKTTNTNETRTENSFGSSSGTATEKKPGGGLLGSLGSIAGAAASIFSDRRLKDNIELVGEFDDGLGIYTFNYLWDEEPRMGVMADEVAEFRPWAMGTPVDGFATVNYGAL